jgi:hypothetical protein
MRTRSHELVAFLALLSVLSAIGTAAAQPPDGEVPFGGLRVPACPRAADPEYGLVREKPILIGGGPMYMAARKARYFAALRGPGGQTLRVAPNVGSAMTKDGDELMFIDDHSVSYDGPNGPVNVTLYMNAYRFELPRVPAGFTCGAPLPTAVGMAPVNPVSANPNLAAIAAGYSSRPDVVPALLDATSPGRGYLADQFAMIALRARAAAAAGTTLDISKPIPDTQGFVVLALPQTCSGRTIAPQRLEMIGPQGPLPQGGELMRDEAIARVLPGVAAPSGSIAARFPSAQQIQARITYAEACEASPAEVTVPIGIEPPRLVTSVIGTIPNGVAETDPVYLQTIIDIDGRFVRPAYLGGPKALLPTALETIAQWRASPLRINGTPTITAMIVQVLFRQP